MLRYLPSIREKLAFFPAIFEQPVLLKELQDEAGDIQDELYNIRKAYLSEVDAGFLEHTVLGVIHIMQRENVRFSSSLFNLKSPTNVSGATYALMTINEALDNLENITIKLSHIKRIISGIDGQIDLEASMVEAIIDNTQESANVTQLETFL